MLKTLLLKQKTLSLLIIVFLFSNGLNAHDPIPPNNSKGTDQHTLSFIENKGQWTAEAKYKAEIPGGSLFLTDAGFVYNFMSLADLELIHEASSKPDNEDNSSSIDSIHHHAYKINFLNANKDVHYVTSGKKKEYNNYFIESDAVPAFYNSYKMGHNNRIGNGFKLSVESKSWGIIFSGEYYKADLLRNQGPIASGLQQNNQETFYFKMETMYDFI